MEYGGDYAEDYDIGGPGTEYGNDWADFASAQLGIDFEDYGIADSGFDTTSRDYSSPPGSIVAKSVFSSGSLFFEAEFS